MSTKLDPKERSARGVALQEKIYGLTPPEPQTPWEESIRDFVYAEVWNRPGLDLRSRFLIGIAGAALCRFPQSTIDGIAEGALRTGELTLAELREAALHLAVYGGWGTGDLVDKAATRAAEKLGLPSAKRPPIRAEAWDPDERTATGQQEFINAMTFPGGPSSNPFQEAINNFVFGEMWPREGLDQRSRRWLTLVGVAESRAEIPIKSHFHAAMASGNCTPDEMKEFVLAYGLCAGWPKASAVSGIVLEMIAKVEAGLPWNG
jgi:4-carboxymuconolactone decarboxylase